MVGETAGGEDEDMKEGGRYKLAAEMAAAVVRGRKMKDGRRKGGGRFLYVSFNGHYFYAIVFMQLFLCNCFYAVVLFSFLCCFIDEGAIKLGEGMDVVAPVC